MYMCSAYGQQANQYLISAQLFNRKKKRKKKNVNEKHHSGTSVALKHSTDDHILKCDTVKQQSMLDKRFGLQPCGTTCFKRLLLAVIWSEGIY